MPYRLCLSRHSGKVQSYQVFILLTNVVGDIYASGYESRTDEVEAICVKEGENRIWLSIGILSFMIAKVKMVFP